MKNIIQKTLLISVIVFLSGCSSMNSSFVCPYKSGVMCRSLDQVNDMVDRGIIGAERVEKTKTSRSYLSALSVGEINKQTMNGRFSSLRAGEQVVRIWIAPYQDVNGNYHNESTIYTVVRKNNWDVPKEITE